MLHTFIIQNNKIDIVPAIVHIDKTARVQALDFDDNVDLFRIIKEFENQTGVPMICNTSLNDKGEPIIDSIEETLNFALRKGIEVVYINMCRVELYNHESYYCNKPMLSKLDFFGYISEDEKKDTLEKRNPFDVPKDILDLYFKIPLLNLNFPLTNELGIKGLYRAIDILKKNNPEIIKSFM